jgi:hypothetical protein
MGGEQGINWKVKGYSRQKTMEASTTRALNPLDLGQKRRVMENAQILTTEQRNATH